MSTQLLKNSQRMLKTFENANRSTTENTSGTRVREARDGRIFENLYRNVTAKQLEDRQKFFDTTYVFSAVIDRNDEPIDMESMAGYPSDFSFDSVMKIVESKEAEKTNDDAIENKIKVVINVSSTYEISVVPHVSFPDDDVVRQGIGNILKKGIPGMKADKLKSLAQVSGLVRQLKAQNQEYEINFEDKYSKAYFEYMTYGKESEDLKYSFYKPISQPNEMLDFDEKLAGIQQLHINIMDYSIWLISRPYRSFPELDLFYDPGFKNEFCNIIMSGKTTWPCCYLKPMAAAILLAKKCKKLNIDYRFTFDNRWIPEEFEKICKELL